MHEPVDAGCKRSCGDGGAERVGLLPTGQGGGERGRHEAEKERAADEAGLGEGPQREAVRVERLLARGALPGEIDCEVVDAHAEQGMVGDFAGGNPPHVVPTGLQARARCVSERRRHGYAESNEHETGCHDCRNPLTARELRQAPANAAGLADEEDERAHQEERQGRERDRHTLRTDRSPDLRFAPGGDDVEQRDEGRGDRRGDQEQHGEKAEPVPAHEDEHQQGDAPGDERAATLGEEGQLEQQPSGCQEQAPCRPVDLRPGCEGHEPARTPSGTAPRSRSRIRSVRRAGFR